MDLTPVEDHLGILLKREDLFRDPDTGVNGSKYRAWASVVPTLRDQGFSSIVVGGSVHAPTVPIAAVLAKKSGLGCTVIVGGTTPEKAVRHHYIRMAADAGATIEAIKVGYNPALQSAARAWAAEHPGCWQLSPPESENYFQAVGAQTMNLPDEVETLIVPLGSGATATGVLYGLHDFAPASLAKVVLVGIGPDHLNRVYGRLSAFGRDPQVPVEHLSLHGWFADYSDRMKESWDGIEMHPTYEGKVVRFLNSARSDYWTRRDGTTCLWIVGGQF